MNANDFRHLYEYHFTINRKIWISADHRTQLLALLHQVGAKTFPQDYAFFIEGRM